jgi:protein-S-isoprenylcysteine O-methyltransferase Ste14
VPPSTDAWPPPSRMPDLLAPLARLRVPIGFAATIAALLLARPTWTSIGWGLVLAVAGETTRFWAAGHLEKGREVTSSGPYRFTGHPLYLGSTLLGAGFAVASNSWAVGVLAVLYLALTLGAAIRSEEAGLREKFGCEYEAYRAGRGAGQARRFSLKRAIRNREHRAVTGVAAVMILLALKTWLLLQ